MKTNKYTYLYVLQGNYGYGWDDLVSANYKNKQEMKELRQDYKAYKENENYPHRIIYRRILNK